MKCNGVFLVFSAMLILASCEDQLAPSLVLPEPHKSISLIGTINQEYATRANDSGFTAGDCMGIYVVDYDAGLPGALATEGNRANNVQMTLGSDDHWTCSTTLYWKDESTAIDVYGYYPYEGVIESIPNHGFTVEADQSTAPSDGELGGYEKSDFLWAKAANVQPTSSPIMLDYAHRMSGVKITLVQGDGFVGEEWNKVPRTVSVNGTIRKALINLVTGIVTANGSPDKNIVAAPQGDDVFRAVVVPQEIAAGTAFIGATIDGTSYFYTLPANINLQAGKMKNTFSLRVDKKTSGDYSLSLVSQDIEDWTNDNLSHQFESSAYVVVHCPVEGTLESCVAAAGIDANTVQNLKITGRMNDVDFQFIREKTPVLTSLNLKDVVSIGNLYYRWWIDNEMLSYCEELWPYYYIQDPNTENPKTENILPRNALNNKTSLRHLVLPNNLKVIGSNALQNLQLSTNSTLILPNSILEIEGDALRNISGCFLEMPDSLVSIGRNAFYCAYSRFELKLSNSLKYIGDGAFGYAQSCYGNLNLLNSVKYIGSNAFENCGNDLQVNIDLSNVTSLAFQTFNRIGAKGSINLNLGVSIQSIGNSAFSSGRFDNYIEWPNSLMSIGSGAFSRCDFRGGCSQLPKYCTLGESAFSGCDLPSNFQLPEELSSISNSLLSGSNIQSITIPKNVESIGAQAFYDCKDLNTIEIGSFVEDIGDWAFLGCSALRSITCLNPEPPILGRSVFLGCDFEHLILQVPASSVSKYKVAEGWKQIKYITAYHELATNVGTIKCLDKGITRDMIVRSEGEWEVSSCPSWCHVSQTSSDIRTTEIQVKVDASSEARSGEIIFKLKGKDYTTTCNVEQYIASMQEDKEIILQTASSGSNPIPIFIVGDGFTADQIADGTYLSLCNEQMEHFFAIEPYKTYRNYFTVSTSLAVSPESGISNVDYIVKNKFNTTVDPGTGYRCDYSTLRDYVCNVSDIIDNSNIGNALILVVMNQNNFGGNTVIEDDGMTVAFTALSPDTYPYDTRGLVQYYAGGRGFGRLAPEDMSIISFFKTSLDRQIYLAGKAKGWYKNVSESSSMNAVPWSHLIFDSRYSDIVDIYEGGFHYSRGIYRSEPRSCMSDYSQYYNTISRELIIRRIKELAGETFDFEDFVSNDSMEGRPEN